MKLKSYKIGDRVKIVRDAFCWQYGNKSDIGIVGEITEIYDGILSFEWWIEDEKGSYTAVCGNQLIKMTGKEAPMKKMKWGISYELDSDPVELFATRKEADERIEDLIDEGAQKIYLFEISKVYKIVKTGFEVKEI